MTGPLERPERYMLADHSVAMVPGDIAAWLIHAIGIRELRTAQRENPRRHAVLVALTIVGQNHAAEVNESDQRKSTEIATRSEWMDVEEVRTHLKVTPHRVTQLIRCGAIKGEKDGRKWRIHRSELARYLAVRMP